MRRANRQTPHRFKRRSRHRSISRWAKDNRELLQHVTLQHAPQERWRRGERYAIWRHQVLARDGHRCVRCGAKTGLTVHHRIPAAICAQLRFAIENGETLCDRCHDKAPHNFSIAFWKKLIGHA